MEPLRLARRQPTPPPPPSSLSLLLPTRRRSQLDRTRHQPANGFGEMAAVRGRWRAP
ncbi:hypothetical protein BDA96_10G159500 [Sorghum bicolor]|uniref:Uncharacterized protein n=1 Tax=Sorghum bicolor TaxID=4558 RepID=A0A921Q499_SORBI|nr:hypothetical protein BDA96_10G159500 [Sorghum bicolor]